MFKATLSNLRDSRLDIATGFRISEQESFAGSSLVRFLSPSFWQSSSSWWHAWYLRHWAGSTGALVHQALSVMCPSLPKYFRSLQSQIVWTRYNRKIYAFDTILLESGLDSMVGSGLTYQCHDSLIFYLTEIMIIKTIIPFACEKVI